MKVIIGIGALLLTGVSTMTSRQDIAANNQTKAPIDNDVDVLSNDTGIDVNWMPPPETVARVERENRAFTRWQASVLPTP